MTNPDICTLCGGGPHEDTPDYPMEFDWSSRTHYIDGVAVTFDLPFLNTTEILCRDCHTIRRLELGRTIIKLYPNYTRYLGIPKGGKYED